MMLLENMICLFSNKGNDQFLSAESKKEEISNSKTSLVIISKTKTKKTSLTKKKKKKENMKLGAYMEFTFTLVKSTWFSSRKLMNSMKFSSVG